jgi:acetyl-CoA carboxylase biotin carboxyl carrier protein
MAKNGFRLKLQKGAGDQTVMTAAPPTASLPAGGASSAAPQIAAGPGEPQTEAGPPLKDIVSPMVGTFYRAASPESPPFAEVGKNVTEETVVCIIEAMKVMNEIKAEVQGTIAEVVAENGKPVQFGQVLFRVR